MASQNSTARKSNVGDTRRNIWLLIAMTILVIASIVVFMPPQEKINQGLDIRGGLSVVLTATSTDGDAITDEDMEASRAIIENRVNALGASEASVSVQGDDQILVQIPGLSDTETALATIGKTGKLEFARLDSFTDEEVKSQIEQGQYGNESVIYDSFGNAFPSGETIHLEVTDGTYTPIVTGDNIESVNVDRESEASAYYAVNLSLDSDGTKGFADASRDLYPTHGQIVIILDNEVQSAPAVQSEIPNGRVSITGNYTREGADALKTILESGSLPVSFEYSQSQVVGPTLGQDALAAGVFAALLGIIIVMIYLLFFYKGLGLVTAGAVIVFAILYLGILAGLSRFGLFSLSLAGIAGIVLTIGMAADSSVLTVERFREEIRMGRSVRAASITGVRHAIQTSIDADLVSLVSGIVLFIVGAASVKGFGLTLTLGILCDIVMMLLFKAPLVRLLAPKAIANHPGFWNVKDSQVAADEFAALGAVEGVTAGEAEIGEALDYTESDRIAKERGGEAGLAVAQAVHKLKGRFIKHDINFLGRRKIFLIVSAVLVAASLCTFAFKGITPGIEFVGGTSITFHDTGDATADDLRAAFEAAGDPDARIQTTTDANGQNGFLVRSSTTDAEAASAMATQVGTQLGLESTNYEVTTIGPDWGSSVIQKSLFAFVLSLVLIIIYIAIRFRDYKMGIIAVVTLLHDLIIVVGVYALVGRELTPNAVAALLTILGYSLYDTVVVFHRINDNMKDLNIKCTFMTMANHSVNQVFTRSINTTITSLLPVICMLILGGETLQDFAFAMVIGLIVGCYSSIGVASPLYSMWKTHEQRFAKIAKKYGQKIGYFEFDRGGSNTVATLGKSKAARIKTARVKQANAQAALKAHEVDAAEAEVEVLEAIAEDAVEQVKAEVGEGSASDPNVYQQVVRNPNKSKRKRRR